VGSNNHGRLFGDGGFGNDGNDTLTGGGGNDRLDGGAGDDRYLFAVFAGADDIVESGSGGTDTLDYSASSRGVSVDLNSTDGVPQAVTLGHSLLIRDGSTGRESDAVMENVVGSNLRDTFIGNSLNNRLEGRGGDDIMTGLFGDDTYVFNGSNLGNDTVDELSFEGDADWLDYSGADARVKIDLSIITSQSVSPNHSLRFTDRLGIENVIGTRFNDRVDGNDRNNEIWGGDGDDVLKNDLGNDSVHGGLGWDTLTGGAGNDTLWGDEGNDFLHGDRDNDTLYGGSGSDNIFGNDGDDHLHAGIANEHAWPVYCDGAKDVLHGGNDFDRFYELDWGWVVDETPDRTDEERGVRVSWPVPFPLPW
jgi:serralysin